MAMTKLFSSVLNMSLTASIVILAVCLARLVLKKAPKIYSYILWALVLFRLLCPVSFFSSFSVIPDHITSGEAISGWSDDYIGEVQIHHDNGIEYAIAVEAGREPISADEGHFYVVTGSDSISEPKTIENTIMPYLAGVWIMGMLVLILQSIVSYANIRKQTRVSVPYRKNIYIADDIVSPFVMGFFRPVIYLPGTLEASERKYIIAHEWHHIRRGDHIFKALGFLALTIHWFNPLVWVAFVLAGRDMEMSCDEAVIRKYGEHVRADYSASLLNLATGHRMFAGTPLAFGEGDPTGRVRNLANWKKPTFWVILVCIVLCVVLTICLVTDPSSMHLYEIDDSRNYSDLFTNTDNITLIREGEEFSVYDDERLLEQLDEVLVRKLPISRNRSEDRDKTNRIRLRDKLYLNFSWDYTHVWIDNLVKPTYSYRVNNPDKVRDIFATIAVLQDNSESSELSVNADWGVSLVPDRVSRTGATALFAYSGSVPGEEGAELTYGDFLSLERLVDGKWVACDELAGFNYFVGDASYPVVDGYGMVHEWPQRFGELADGHYRIGKRVTLTRSDGTSEERMIYGEFSIPDSILTGPIPLEELPELYSAEQAMIDGCFVQDHDVARENRELFHEFAANSWTGVSSFIRIVNSHYGEETNYTAYDLNYDGSVYTITWLEDGHRQSTEYRYLMHFTGEKERENMAYDAYEHYVLVNDNEVSWLDIWNGLISSQHHADIDFMIVYSDYIYYPEIVAMPENLAQVDLEFEGESLVTTTDFDRLEKIYLLFDNAEVLSYEPKTHSIGVGLNLILTSQNGETMTIELDPDNDICRINGEYVFYGAFDEPSYVEKLWYYLDIPAWPEQFYEKYPNAFRP